MGLALTLPLWNDILLMLMAHGTTTLNANGRVVIPAAVRRELGLDPGTELTVGVEDGRVVIETRENLLRRIRAEWQAAAGEESMVDELIADRRLEAAKEQRELEKWTSSRSSTPRR